MGVGMSAERRPGHSTKKQWRMRKGSRALPKGGRTAYWKSRRQLHVAECAWGLDNQSSKRGRWDRHVSVIRSAAHYWMTVS